MKYLAGVFESVVDPAVSGWCALRLRMVQTGQIYFSYCRKRRIVQGGEVTGCILAERDMGQGHVLPMALLSGLTPRCFSSRTTRGVLLDWFVLVATATVKSFH